MTTQSKETPETRCRLLEAACEVFAEKGYRDATVAEICKRANANIAAVNYHFRDKEHLYAEAWRHAFHVAREAYPSDGGLSDDATAEARLRAHVSAHLHRTFDEGRVGQFSSMMFSEMGTPTKALHDVMHEVIRPHRDRFLGIVRELLGPEASEPQVHLCGMSVMNQCMAFAFKKRIRKHILGAARRKALSVDELTDHIVRFSLAGIQAVRERAASGASTPPDEDCER